MIEPAETLFLAGAAFSVAGITLLGHTDIAGGVALGIALVAVLRAFWQAGAA